MFEAVLLDLVPTLVVGAAAWVLVVRASRPHAEKLAAWKERKKEIDAAIAAESYKLDNFEHQAELMGQRDAHAIMRPDIPKWMFWLK